MDLDFERPYFDGIGSAQTALRQSRAHSGQGIPRFDSWGVTRDDRYLGLLQTHGTLRRPGTDPLSLMTIYNEKNRSILPTSTEIRHLLTS